MRKYIGRKDKSPFRSILRNLCRYAPMRRWSLIPLPSPHLSWAALRNLIPKNTERKRSGATAVEKSGKHYLGQEVKVNVIS